jgi:CheY-like chemotaxis protein
MRTCEILIVDDDEDDIQMLTEAFVDVGLNNLDSVCTAMHASKYLENLVHPFLPKLIITDLFLPAITGTQFLINLKGIKKFKHIHVVILSSLNGCANEIQNHIKLGALDCIAKPLTCEGYVYVAEKIKRKAALG